MLRPDSDPEVQELKALRDRDPVASRLLTTQSREGSWSGADLGGNVLGNRIQATSQALASLGYLGFGPDHPAVQRGAGYLFSKQQGDGAWPRPGEVEEVREVSGYTMMPLQTAIPLAGLSACGYAADPRAECAYDWLLGQRLEDGAWPTGKIGGVFGGVAGYRRLAHSRWGCRSNTTAALTCLASHPHRRFSEEARRALDLILGRETREKRDVGFSVARIIGLEPHRGYLTYFAKFDLALLLDLCASIGADREDERVAGLVEFIRGLQGPYGLWEYVPRPEASRWVSFDLLRSLSRLDKATDWLSLEPRTPFTPYPRRPRRF